LNLESSGYVCQFQDVHRDVHVWTTRIRCGRTSGGSSNIIGSFGYTYVRKFVRVIKQISYITEERRIKEASIWLINDSSGKVTSRHQKWSIVP
jgi:hypothetical protein